jgi:Tol biopolymer transport system component
MNPPSQTSPPEFRSFWALWIAVTFGGALAVLVPALGCVLFVLVGEASQGEQAIQIAVPFFFLSFGLLAGAGQARLLRPWLTERAFWAWGGALVLLVASLLIYAVTGAYFAMPASDDRLALSVVTHIGQGAVLGAAIGLVQFPVLARTRYPPRLWLLASILIWASADGLGTLFSGPEGADASEVRWLLNFLLMPLLAAVAGGGAMAWLLGLPGRRLSFLALGGVLTVAAAGLAVSGTWALPLIQEQPGRQFGEVFFARRPAWSPDGQQIAFVWGEHIGAERLYSAPAGGGRATALSGYHAAVLFVRWAPGGDYLCYGSPSEIFVAAAAGHASVVSPTCRLSETRSADGRWTASVGADRNNIHVRGSDGAERVLEVENPDWLVWSPDSSRLLFRTFRDDNYDVHMINLDGTGETNLSQHPGRDSQPMWLLGGREIIFESDRNGASNLYLLPLDGGSPRPLTANPNPGLSFYGVAPSPSDRRIVYHTHGQSFADYPAFEGAGPHVLRVDDSRLVTLPEPDRDEFWTWSPDGTLLMAARRGGIWVARADGTQLRQLTFSFDE